MSNQNLILGTAVLATAVTLIAVYFSVPYVIKSVRPNEEEEVKEEVLDLLLGEEKGLIYASSTSTITFFEGDITNSFDLKQRVSEIIKKNPWLMSTLTYRKRVSDKKEKHLVAVYPSKLDQNTISLSYQEIITVISIDSVNEGDSWEIINQKALRFTVKTGAQCVEKREERLFRVTLLKQQNQDSNKIEKTVLIVSLSHVIGDGQTFYTLYSFLNPQTPTSEIRALEAKRLMDFPDQIDRLYGKEFQQYLQSVPFLFGVLSTILASKRPSVTVLAIDQVAINRLKKQLSSTTFFLSTNDILTSWYFKTCDCDYGIMAINFREKLNGYTSDHAGNYEGMIFYNQADYQSPLDIRKSLASKLYQSKTNSIPTTWQTLRYNFSCITNWSSFYSQLVFDNAKHLVHFPLYDIGNSVFKDMAIIFSPRKNELALCLLHRSPLPQDQLLQSSNFLKVFSST